MQPEQKLLTLFQNVVKKWMMIVDMKLSAYGISHTEARLLMLLYDKNGCAQDYLSSMVEVDRTNVSRALKKLETAGYIMRVKDETDARALTIFLTDHGNNFKSILSGIQNNLESCFADGLAQSEIKKMLIMMTKLDKAFAELNHD